MQVALAAGLEGVLRDVAGAGTAPSDLLRVAGVGAVAANGVNNLPAYLALEPAVSGDPVRLMALLIGVGVAPIVTLWASLATLLWRERCLRGGVRIDARRFAIHGLLLAVPAVLVMQSLFAIGEEAGWRGWLHGELRPLGFWPMSLLVGVMWAVWHAPIVLALGLAPREAVTYLGTIVAVAPLLSALREISGTAWVAVLGHGLLNSARVAIEQNVLGPLEPETAWLLDLSSWALWIAAAWMVLRLGGTLRRADAALPAAAGSGRARPGR